jgi:hypothetical protein
VKNLDISVVIRCSDDNHIFKCIKSIDSQVEIIVSLTENKKIQKKLEDMGIKYCITPKGNLSITSNAGFNVTSFNKVIITDSDTIFGKKCVEKMFNALNDFKCARVNLKTLWNSSLRFSNIVAKGISYVFSLPLAFTPGLAVRKDILTEIGGFLFNEPVPFAVDADLNHRIKKAKIPIKFLKDAYLYHLPCSLKHSLKAAFRIGKGVRISVEHLNLLLKESKRYLMKSLKAVKPNAIFDILFRKGLKLFLYQLFWDLFYYIGYYYQKVNKR